VVWLNQLGWQFAHWMLEQFKDTSNKLTTYILRINLLQTAKKIAQKRF
jgi:hypothetical protein